MHSAFACCAACAIAGGREEHIVQRIGCHKCRAAAARHKHSVQPTIQIMLCVEDSVCPLSKGPVRCSAPASARGQTAARRYRFSAAALAAEAAAARPESKGAHKPLRNPDRITKGRQKKTELFFSKPRIASAVAFCRAVTRACWVPGTGGAETNEARPANPRTCFRQCACEPPVFEHLPQQRFETHLIDALDSPQVEV